MDQRNVQSHDPVNVSFLEVVADGAWNILDHVH